MYNVELDDDIVDSVDWKRLDHFLCFKRMTFSLL